jgi:hypothetical protein
MVCSLRALGEVLAISILSQTKQKAGSDDRSGAPAPNKYRFQPRLTIWAAPPSSRRRPAAQERGVCLPLRGTKPRPHSLALDGGCHGSIEVDC